MTLRHALWCSPSHLHPGCPPKQRQRHRKNVRLRHLPHHAEKQGMRLSKLKRGWFKRKWTLNVQWISMVNICLKHLQLTSTTSTAQRPARHGNRNIRTVLCRPVVRVGVPARKNRRDGKPFNWWLKHRPPKWNRLIRLVRFSPEHVHENCLVNEENYI